MELIAIGLAAVLALLFVAYPLVSSKRYIYYLDDMLGGKEQKTLNHLYAQRALAYDNLKDLQNEHEMGKLSDGDYQRLRGGLLREAEETIKEIDRAQVKREIDDMIEDQLSAHRKIKE